jgi:hypothetical protein
VSISYDVGTDQTTITLPYKLVAGETYRLVAWYGDPTYSPGQLIPATVITGPSVDQIRVNGDVDRFFFGRQYDFRYTFSTLVLRENAQGGGQQAVGEGRLQLRNMRIGYAKTGYFRAEVTPAGRDTYTYVFSGRTLGSFLDPLGEIGINDGTFKFPVLAQNTQVKIEIVSDSFLPCALLGAEWEGLFVIRSRRM